MKWLAAVFVLFIAVVAQTGNANTCPEGYTECGGNLCCPKVQQ